MSKKRESLRGRGRGLGLLTKAPTQPKPGEKDEPESRNIEIKKPRIVYEQGNFQLLPGQNKKIRVYAAQNKMRVSEVVRLALEEFFRNKEK